MSIVISYLERLKQDDSTLTLLLLSSKQTKIEYALIIALKKIKYINRGLRIIPNKLLLKIK